MLQHMRKFLTAIGVISIASAEAGKNESLELATILSGANPIVLKDITLFNNNKDEYFKIHERELLQRGIEAPEEISPAVALIDSLNSINYMVYADHKEEAMLVLEELNSLTHGKLKASGSYTKLVQHIKEKGDYGTISNYLETSESSYLFQCVTEAHYKLVMIDEDSDAFPLILVPLENFESIKKLASQSGITLKGLEMEGLKP
jgi:hypothetical protein